MERQATARRPRALRLTAADRREQLLDVAAEILRDSGFLALSMERVAERAGVSKGLGYAYFKNADDLAIALYDREVAAVYGRVVQAVRRARSFEERVRAAARAYLDVVAERGALIALLQARMQGRWFARAGRRRVGKFLAFWADQLAGELGVERAVAESLAAAMLSAAEACSRVAGARRLPRAVVEETCVQFQLGGLRAFRGR
ncbi:MAG: TetR/AcrR family transcriptional regulator [Myxococcota bacterium]